MDNLQAVDEKLQRRDRILTVEGAMRQIDGVILGDSEKCPLKHSFGDGIYMREIRIPAGMLIVGKIHRHEHPNMLMSGKVSVLTEDGGVEHYEAPMAMISKPGTKRLLYTHTDTWWITIHRVGEERDLEKIEDIVIAPNYDELNTQLEQDAQKLLNSVKEN